MINHSHRFKRIATAGAAITFSSLLAAPHAAATTYTLEPWDFDQVAGINLNLTETTLGGTLCPCTKIPYPADALHNQQGADAIAATPLKSGDVVLGFSNGSTVISTYLAQNTPPPGVTFILLGGPINPNGALQQAGVSDSFGTAVPADVGAPVNIVSRQYEFWADFPDKVSAPGYPLAVINAWAGTPLHDYRNVSLDDPANVVTTQGNITTTLIPTATLPINDWMRTAGLTGLADMSDAWMRPLIEGAYTRPSSTTSTVPEVSAKTAVTAPTDPKPAATPAQPQRKHSRVGPSSDSPSLTKHVDRKPRTHHDTAGAGADPQPKRGARHDERHGTNRHSDVKHERRPQ